MKNGTTYFGEYSKIEEEIVYFKSLYNEALGDIRVPIKQIQTLKLKDGRFVIEDEKNILTREAQFVRNGILYFAGCWLLYGILLSSFLAGM